MDSKKFKFIEKKLFGLWKEGKIIHVLYEFSNSSQKEILKVECIRDARNEEYFYFEKLNYNFHRRLFNKNKWLVLTRDYKPRKKCKLWEITDLMQVGRLHLQEAIKISATLKDMGFDVPLLDDIKRIK